MEKKTATERLFAQNSIFAQTDVNKEEEEEEEVGKPKSRSSHSFLESLKSGMESK